MSPAREAFGLPFLLLTVAWAGGLRVGAGGGLRFDPPPLMSLVLAVLLMGVMVRGRLLVPALLMSERRSGLENLSGGVVLAALLAACAQIFNCLTPPTGLLRLFFLLFFVFLLWTMMEAQPDRPRLLRSLLVVLGGALVSRHVLLAALFEPEGSLVKRALVVLLEGATLGTLGSETPSRADGYVAFFTVAVFLIALILLPRPRSRALVRVEGEDERVAELT